jgi:short-subunit dehydrogenase
VALTLAKRHVVVTGASRGIGAALAHEAAARGATVTLVARHHDTLEVRAQALHGHAHSMDLSDPDSVENAIDRIEAAAGPIDVLISNAGFNETGPFVEKNAATLRQHVETNLSAPMELSRQLIPRMLEREHGSIAIVSSIGGEIAMANNLLYNTTKAGLNMFAATLHRELSQTPVNVLLVLLGAVDTDMLTASLADPIMGEFTKKTKIKPLRTEQVATGILTALERGQTRLVMPSRYTPLCAIRELPTRINDVVMKSVLRDRSRSIP